MRENRQSGSEGGVATSHPDPYLWAMADAVAPQHHHLACSNSFRVEHPTQ